MDRTPDGKVQRELTIWTEDSGNVQEPSEAVHAAARAAYGDDGQAIDGKERFVAVFGAALPADLTHEGLTNHGLFGIGRSRMGRTFTYVERMPGQINLVELFRVGEHFVDTLVRALTAYARQQPELQDEPEKLKRLERFFQAEFRDDVLNLLLMGWQAAIRMRAVADVRIEPPEQQQESFFYVEAARAVDYLVERGYLRADEIPGLFQEQMERVIQHGIVRKLAVVLGHPPEGPWPPTLAKLDDPDELEHVLEVGLSAIGMTTEEFDAILAPVGPSFFGSDTTGRIVWRSNTEPIRTNGTWNPDKQEVIWDGEGRRGCDPPQVLFAVWAEPDEAFQQVRLGKVALRGEPLYEYIGWRQGLSRAQRAEWDTFVDTLHPGPALSGTLQRFRFRPPATMPTTTASQPADEPSRGVRLILAGLEDDKN